DSITLAPFTNALCTASGGGTLNATSNPLAASSGVASFSGVNYTQSGNLYVQASATGLTPACSSLVSVSVGAADHMIKIAGDAQSATAGSAVTTDPKVQVVDSNGNAVSGVVVTFTVNSGGGSTGAATATTDASGFAS